MEEKEDKPSSEHIAQRLTEFEQRQAKMAAWLEAGQKEINELKAAIGVLLETLDRQKGEPVTKEVNLLLFLGWLGAKGVIAIDYKPEKLAYVLHATGERLTDVVSEFIGEAYPQMPPEKQGEVDGITKTM